MQNREIRSLLQRLRVPPEKSQKFLMTQHLTPQMTKKRQKPYDKLLRSDFSAANCKCCARRYHFFRTKKALYPFTILAIFSEIMLKRDQKRRNFVNSSDFVPYFDNITTNSAHREIPQWRLPKSKMAARPLRFCAIVGFSIQIFLSRNLLNVKLVKVIVDCLITTEGARMITILQNCV